MPPDVVFFSRFATGEWASRGALLDLRPMLAQQAKDDPLAAALYYNVAQVYAAQDKPDDAARAAAVAGVIDRKFAKQGSDGARLP